MFPITEETDAVCDILAYNTWVHPPWQHKEEESDPGEAIPGIPYNPFSYVFFRPIMLKEDKVDVSCFQCGGLNINTLSFFFFNSMTCTEVQAKYQNSGIVNRDAVLTTYYINKHSGIKYINTSGALEPNLFNLSTCGYVLAQPVQDDSSDLEDRPSPPLDNGPTNIDTQLLQL